MLTLFTVEDIEKILPEFNVRQWKIHVLPPDKVRIYVNMKSASGRLNKVALFYLRHLISETKPAGTVIEVIVVEEFLRPTGVINGSEIIRGRGNS